MSRYDFTGVAEWSRIPGWFDLPKAIAIQQIVKELPPGSTLVELGSFQGRSSVAIASVLPAGSVLHCVDHFEGSPEHRTMKLDLSNLFESFQRNIAKFGVQDRIRVLRMSTIEAAARFDRASVDAILLDASHDFVSVKSDLEHWYPKLKPAGVLFCDDYEPAWPGVQQAVEAVGLTGEVIARALFLHRKPVDSR
jgi:predicted O-methyltransferase YrrM